MVLVGALAAWLAVHIGRAVGRRIGDRVAAWLLPDGQPWTYRLALGITIAAGWLEPKKLLRCREREPRRPLERFFQYRLEQRASTWTGAHAARAKLEWALRMDISRQRPVKLAVSVLRVAILLNAQNMLNAATFTLLIAFSSLYLILVCSSMLLWMPVLMLFMFLYAAERWARRKEARRSTRAS
jgi:hypothetical protein